MFGYHLLKEGESHCGGRGNNVFSHLQLWNQGDLSEIILNVTEKYDKDIHQQLIDDGYVSASVRVNTDELIRNILEMIPFWRIKQYVEKDKRRIASNWVEELRSVGVEDATVDYIKDVVLNYGVKNKS
mgnify:CR=1 FL=1